MISTYINPYSTLQNSSTKWAENNNQKQDDNVSSNSFREQPVNEEEEYELDPSLKMLEDDQGGVFDIKRGKYRESIGSF